MTLVAGVKLGPYEIAAPIGADVPPCFSADEPLSTLYEVRGQR